MNATDNPPAKLDLTAFQKTLHGMSTKQATRSTKTRGAFGGVTVEERLVRRLRRRMGK